MSHILLLILITFDLNYLSFISFLKIKKKNPQTKPRKYYTKNLSIKVEKIQLKTALSLEEPNKLR